MPKTIEEINLLVRILKDCRDFNNFLPVHKIKTIDSYYKEVVYLCENVSHVWEYDVENVHTALVECLKMVEQPNKNLIHGDFHLGNIIWNDKDGVALVDWDNWALGDVESDVAHCYIDILLLSNKKVAQTFLNLCVEELNLEYFKLRFF